MTEDPVDEGTRRLYVEILQAWVVQGFVDQAVVRVCSPLCRTVPCHRDRRPEPLFAADAIRPCRHADDSPSRHDPHSPSDHMNGAITSWPRRTRRTCEPTSSTIPRNSCPDVRRPAEPIAVIGLAAFWRLLCAGEGAVGEVGGPTLLSFVTVGGRSARARRCAGLSAMPPRDRCRRRSCRAVPWMRVLRIGRSSRVRRRGRPRAV